MAQKLTIAVLGGATKTEQSYETVKEIKQALGLGSYTATVNGESVDDDDDLPDFGYVSLAPAVKGG